MKNYIKIVSNMPCDLFVNNSTFFVENDIILEILDEKEIFFNFIPNNEKYSNIFFKFDKNFFGNDSVRITKYNLGYKIEVFFKNVNSKKSLIKNGYEVCCYDSYMLKKDDIKINLEGFKNSYYDLDILDLNEKFLCVMAFYKLKENINICKENQKIDLNIIDKENNLVIHNDTISFFEFDKNVFKIYTYLYDQNSQVLVCEFNTKNNNFLKQDFYSCYTKQKPNILTKKYEILRSFFECILAQNTSLSSFYLADDLKTKVKNKNLHTMFDNFVKIDTEFLENLDEVNLIKKVKNNFYEATTYKVEFKQDKINNIVSIT